LIHCMHSSCDRRYDLQQLEHPGKVQLVPCGGMQLILSPGGLLGHGHCVVPQSGHLTPGPPGEMGGHSCGGEVLGSQYTVGRGGGGAALAQTTKVTIICIFMASRIVGAEPDSIAASVTAAVRLRCLNYAPWPAAAPSHRPSAAAGARGFSTHAPRRSCVSRFYGIQFYGFRVRAAVQDSWFAVHARIACMTDGQPARFAWNSACDPHAY
jgi:hypothetical protein